LAVCPKVESVWNAADLNQKVTTFSTPENRPNPLEMDIQVPRPNPLGDRPISFLERVGVSSEVVLLSTIRHYFTGLRQQKGHQPDASPMDLEILLIIKMIHASCDDPVDVLRKVGIILVVTGNLRFHIAINNTLLVETLVSSRSRINNTLKRLEWEMIPIPNAVKYELLKGMLDRGDVRNWTLRTVPSGTALWAFAEATPEIRFRAENTELPGSLRIGDGGEGGQGGAGLAGFG
jgi:hypothetical protein